MRCCALAQPPARLQVHGRAAGGLKGMRRAVTLPWPVVVDFAIVATTCVCRSSRFLVIQSVAQGLQVGPYDAPIPFLLLEPGVGPSGHIGGQAVNV